MVKTSALQYVLRIVLIAIIFVNVGSVVIAHWSSYATKTYWRDFSSLQMLYRSSQYVNKHPKGWIPDEAVNSYAGGAYIRGIGPHLIAPDTPPLGRYLIGVSTVVFDNPNEVTLIAALLSLFLMFVIGRQIFKNNTLALIPVVLVSTEPIFLNQLIYTPLLDIIQLVFLLSSFYFFNKGLMKKTILHFSLAIFCIGCFMATKFFITGLTILGAMGILLLVHKRFKKLLMYILLSPMSLLVLLGSYVRVFAYGYSLKAFLGIQKWVFLYHKSQLILPFSIWPLLLFNKWYVWFGNTPVISDGQWRFTWPFLVVVSFVTIVFYFFKRIQKNIPIETLMVWSILYILFFSFGEISSRYLVIYIPILYIISVFGLWQVGLFLYTRYRK